MKIESPKHRGLRLMIEKDSARGLPPDMVNRIRSILAVLALADDMGDFVASARKGWGVHQLSGNRRGVWSVSVSGNWRITFEVECGTIGRLDLEDYH